MKNKHLLLDVNSGLDKNAETTIECHDSVKKSVYDDCHEEIINKIFENKLIYLDNEKTKENNKNSANQNSDLVAKTPSSANASNCDIEKEAPNDHEEEKSDARENESIASTSQGNIINNKTSGKNTWSKKMKLRELKIKLERVNLQVTL